MTAFWWVIGGLALAALFLYEVSLDLREQRLRQELWGDDEEE